MEEQIKQIRKAIYNEHSASMGDYNAGERRVTAAKVAELRELFGEDVYQAALNEYNEALRRA